MQDDMSWLSNEKYEAEEAKGCKNNLSHLLFLVYGSTWISGMAAANNYEKSCLQRTHDRQMSWYQGPCIFTRSLPDVFAPVIGHKQLVRTLNHVAYKV